MRRTKRGIIPYDIRLTKRARDLRKDLTAAEKAVWKILRENRLGYKFLCQKPIGGFIADFYCSKLLLVIEIDGKIHEQQKEYDHERSLCMAAYGVKVERIQNAFVLSQHRSHVENVLISIIKRRESELSKQYS